nr:hypothetical protein [Halapricum sp. CBA1109]
MSTRRNAGAASKPFSSRKPYSAALSFATDSASAGETITVAGISPRFSASGWSSSVVNGRTTSVPVPVTMSAMPETNPSSVPAGTRYPSSTRANP